MKSNDFNEELLEKLTTAVNGSNMQEVLDVFREIVKESNATDEQIEELRQEIDEKILANRGHKQLTSEERKYYEAVLGAMRSNNPKQAITNIDLTFPETITNEVFEELRTNHPILSKIDFVNSHGHDRFLIDTSEAQKAAWGELCDEIVKEVVLSLKEVETGLFKLSAFLFACKPGMELGAAWLDSWVRQHLYEALASGLVKALLTGTGNKEPIGMDRDIEGAVVGGVYPQKEAVVITNFDLATVGNLVNLVSMNNGKARKVENLVLICSTADYYKKIMPATMVMAPDGSYRSILPFNIDVIAEPEMPTGKAIFGLAKRYFASAGIPKEGRIEYSDEYKFLEDKRTYIIKTYANGMPKDNNAFLLLDVSGVVPATYKVTAIDNRTPSDDAKLANLKIGSLTLTPAFDPDVDTYTASTTNATNIITATPGEANQQIAILNGSTPVENGTAATWASGDNTVTITVTAEDGTTTETYTVTVTKS